MIQLQCTECHNPIYVTDLQGLIILRVAHIKCPPISCPCLQWLKTQAEEVHMVRSNRHHPNCDGKGNQRQTTVKMEQTMENNTLQLLVIDLGDSCVVKVEKGKLDLPMFHTFGKDRTVMMSGHSFDQIRQELGGDKPHLRIERQIDADGMSLVVMRNNGKVTSFGEYAYNALSELAGKPLPIYNGGLWEELQRNSEEGISIWRYTR